MAALIQGSLAKSTQATYMQAHKQLSVFLQSLNMSMPLTPVMAALFVTFLHTRRYAYSTIVTYSSAVAFFHKLHSFPDPTQHFLVQKSLLGIRKISKRIDARLPITIDILGSLSSSLDHLSMHMYDKILLRAMFSLAFFAFMRVGEFTVSQAPQHTLQLADVKLAPATIHVTFRSFKHSRSPVSIQIVPFESNPYICPVRSLSSYLRQRGASPGPLFIDIAGTPITRAKFTKSLGTVFKFLSLDTSRYKGHSFRIGAATYAMSKGCSDCQIRTMGRWSSNAFMAYIRS